jgi:hypothetical protein
VVNPQASEVKINRIPASRPSSNPYIRRGAKRKAPRAGGAFFNT